MTSIPPPGSDPKTSWNGRLYIHESVVISVEHRKAYLQHFTDVWAPRSRELYGMRCFGVWATSGSTGPWPEAIVMWELEGPHHLTGMMTGEFDFLKDPVSEAADHFEQFWATAPPGVVATTGFDRLLIASATSRPIAELVAAECGVRVTTTRSSRWALGTARSISRSARENWHRWSRPTGLDLLGHIGRYFAARTKFSCCGHSRPGRHGSRSQDSFVTTSDSIPFDVHPGP